METEAQGKPKAGGKLTFQRRYYVCLLRSMANLYILRKRIVGHAGVWVVQGPSDFMRADVPPVACLAALAVIERMLVLVPEKSASVGFV